MKKSELNQLIKEEIKKVLKESTIYDKIQRVNNDKFTNGYGFIGNVAGKKYAIVCYNSRGRSDLKPSDVINLRELSKLKGLVDDSIILNIQAYFMQKATKITKMEASGNDIDLLIVTDHNVNSPEIFTNTKLNKQSSLKETSISDNTLMKALKKAGIEVTDDMNVELKGPTGKTKIVTVNPDGKVTMDEGIKDKLVIAATCLVLASGLVSCTKPNDSDLRPNNAQTELPAGDEENVAPVDFLNTSGKTVTINNILAGLGKYIPKPKFKKGDTAQYKQQTMKPDIKMGLPDSVNIPDSTTGRSDAPWVGYWKFTDPCRTNNQQVMIWTQVGNDKTKGIIYSGYQLPDTNTVYSSAVYKVLADGKKYIISAYTVKYWDWNPHYKNNDPSAPSSGRATLVISSPEVDGGADRPLAIDFIDGGKKLKVASWGGGNATKVNGLSDFKW
jgi:hypothetical protein